MYCPTAYKHTKLIQPIKLERASLSPVSDGRAKQSAGFRSQLAKWYRRIDSGGGTRRGGGVHAVQSNQDLHKTLDFAVSEALSPVWLSNHAELYQL